jgi:hypothetical protein
MIPTVSNSATPSFDSVVSQTFLAILVVCAIQGPITLLLHCIELPVNLSRDEATWRAAGTGTGWLQHGPGARITSNSFVAAALSWQNVVLFVLKALLHWLLGQSVMPSLSWYPTIINGIFINRTADGYPRFLLHMMYSRLLACTIVAIFLAIFATFLAFRRPKGPQPAAWGHSQTLAELIDVWQTGKDGRLWWGDKGVSVDGIRHAGTSQNRMS